MKVRSKKIFLVCSWLLILGCVLISGNRVFAEPRSGDAYYNYGEVLQKAILFYKAQRAGDLPDDYILPYRGDTCMNDGADVGLDLTGGWFDAGDHVKFGMPMAYSAGQMAWGVYEYREGFEQSGLLDTILDEIKWATDYFMKCHPEPDVYYYDCGYGESDHSCWVPPEVVHLFTERTSFKVDPSTPGSDVTSQASAALTLASLIFEPTDPAYAAECLTHARDLFDFADTYQGRFPLDNFYQSGGFTDDLTWAAVWLYIATGEQEYLDKALNYIPIPELGGHHTHCWDDVTYGAAIKLAQITKDPAYIEKVEVNLDWWQPNGGLTYTPGGLAYLSNWGVLRYASTAAFIAFVWSDDETVCSPGKRDAYRTFAEKQLNYALGDNPRNSSYVVGFGENASKHPHHRTTHGSWISMLDVPAFHRHILYGALVGGPDSSDNYVDDIKDYMLNEVADDYNAGFIGSMAKMIMLYGGDPLPNWPQPEDFHPPEGVLNEYFCRGWIQWEGPRDCDVLFQINNRSACPPTVCENMSARYFMDLSEVFAAGYGVNDITIKVQSGDTGAVVSSLTQWTGDVYYFSLSFPGVLIHPGHWDIAEREAIVRITHPIDGATENDWSYQEITTNPDYNARLFTGMTAYIPVYEDGVLLWGEEPPGGTATTPPEATPTPTPVGTPLPTSAPGGELGDVNESGSVDIIDALLTAQYYVDLNPTDFNPNMADTNCDGNLDIIDALLIAQYYVGLITEFC
ncbi:MAG: glycoside hydrolase family 9 protein [Spirochaetales bacterium]|nr:glycoside hydrolase family 9 protein [Spirochaetales bacterium]